MVWGMASSGAPGILPDGVDPEAGCCAPTPEEQVSFMRPSLLICLLALRLLAARDAPATIRHSIQPLAPLCTVIPATQALPVAHDLVAATLLIPAGAPPDLGVGAYVMDDQGRWFQSLSESPLTPGIHRLLFPIRGTDPLHNEGGRASWSPQQRARCSRFGLFLWSADPIPPIGVSDLHSYARAAAPAPVTNTPSTLQQFSVDSWTTACGERWEIRCRAPQVANAYDPDQSGLRAQVTRPDGSSFSVHGFYRQPMSLHDSGDRESARCAAPAHLALRLRPDQPGAWRLRLDIHSAGQRPRHIDLPLLQVTGAPRNEHVRVSTRDPRFFITGPPEAERFHWPIGLNLRSITDKRSQKYLATGPTPDRQLHSYQAYFARLERAHIELVEIWLATWNLGLEGMPSDSGFHGLGQYHEANAERLDRLLDAAWAHGLRVLLVLNHHGQVSSRVDDEWGLNPYNILNGGPCAEAIDIWSDPRARSYQDRLRRYIVARYADHPAVFGWKLWTEIDLTDAGWTTRHNKKSNALLTQWHTHATEHLATIDPYDHPVCTHWSSDYSYVDHQVAAVPQLNFLAIDAYHDNRRHSPHLAELLDNTTNQRYRGLHRLDPIKPVLVTEFGATPTGGPETQLLAELAYAPWVAFVCGHGAGPMLWWFEWIDQNDHWRSFDTITAFRDTEDLRDPQARSVPLQIRGVKRPLWNRAWARRGRIIGYLLDHNFAKHGTGGSVHDSLTIAISNNARPGPIRLEWWNPDTGTLLHSQDWQHPGKALSLPVPAFRRHIAFKLIRLDMPDPS